MKPILNMYRLKNKKINKKFVGLISILVLLIIAFPLLSCSQNKIKVTDSEIERNKNLWQESKISNYNFVANWYQGGTQAWVPVLIKIRNSQIIFMEPIREKKELERTQEYEDFETVEKMFRQIQEKHNNGDKVTVTYNQKFGYPERIRIEPKKGGLDTYFTIEVSKFEITE